MSVQALTWAFAQDLPSSSIKLVLIALANRSDEDGLCYPSIKWIAAQSSQSERTCQRAIDVLVEQGFITKTERYRADGTQDRNLYQLLIGGRVSDCHPRVSDCQGEGDTGVTPKTKINKKIKNARVREDFLREIDEGIVRGAYRDVAARYKLTDDLLRMAAGDAWDYWQGYDKFPPDPETAFRGWLRGWKAETEIQVKRLDAVAKHSGKPLTISERETSEWAARVANWQKTKFWPRDLFGPAPDERGTRVPQDILATLSNQKQEEYA